jgi:hypothetical protein
VAASDWPETVQSVTGGVSQRSMWTGQRSTLIGLGLGLDGPGWAAWPGHMSRCGEATWRSGLKLGWNGLWVIWAWFTMNAGSPVHEPKARSTVDRVYRFSPPSWFMCTGCTLSSTVFPSPPHSCLGLAGPAVSTPR